MIAFGPKGDHFANVSIWFDVLPIKLEQSQIKRSRRLKQKKVSSLHFFTRPVFQMLLLISMQLESKENADP